VYLTTEDVSIAEKIAKAVRHSSGGLRFVKALGLLVEGRAQVSMNLTDFRKTPLARVVEMIRREASRFGVGIHHSELVGLIPEAALVDAAVWYLQLDQFTPDQILEQRLPTAQLAAEGETSATFLDALASASPTPGGGSAAAYGGAMAAALAAMAARVTIGKKKYAAVEAQMQAIITQAEQLRAELSAAVEQDAAAFAGVMTAHKLPKNTPEEVETRAQAIESATRHAARVPLAVAGKAVAVLELAAQVVTHGNSNAISDGASAGALARAALTGAGYNVRINATTLKDKVAVAEMTTQLVLLEEKAIELERQIRQQIEERGG
jgi:glutamate formiminotransferase/formiminotetrahydrofolate cyclodeaminase